MMESGISQCLRRKLFQTPESIRIPVSHGQKLLNTLTLLLLLTPVFLKEVTAEETPPTNSTVMEVWTITRNNRPPFLKEVTAVETPPINSMEMVEWTIIRNNRPLFLKEAIAEETPPTNSTVTEVWTITRNN